jgi:glucokinase
MSDPGRTLAVDLGGTWMRAAVVDGDGRLIARRAEATPRDAACPDALVALVAELLDCGDLAHAVIGLPGRVDYRRGRLEWAPNLPPHWPSALDQRQLSERLGVRVSLANDADLAAVGESFFGAGRGYDDVAYMTISTGIGAGVLLRRRLVAGTRSLAEVGHTIIDVAALRRGEPATLEELGSGTALGRRATAAGLPSDGARIVELVHAADPDAIRLWHDIVSAIGTGVANLALVFTPQVIVLGGGVGRNGDLLLPRVRQYLETYGPQDLPTPIQVVVAELGDDAGLAGAAAWLEATSAFSHG